MENIIGVEKGICQIHQDTEYIDKFNQRVKPKGNKTWTEWEIENEQVRQEIISQMEVYCIIIDIHDDFGKGLFICQECLEKMVEIFKERV